MKCRRQATKFVRLSFCILHARCGSSAPRRLRGFMLARCAHLPPPGGTTHRGPSYRLLAIPGGFTYRALLLPHLGVDALHLRLDALKCGRMLQSTHRLRLDALKCSMPARMSKHVCLTIMWHLRARCAAHRAAMHTTPLLLHSSRALQNRLYQSDA
jgi:hypothetical protein